MTAMKTWRDTNSAPDITRWQYDEATGLLTNKLYADNNGTAYTYDEDGRLVSRTWARGISTAYTYDLAGNLTNINYSDGITLSVSFTYGRTGNQKSITDALGTRTFSYNSAMQMIADSNAYGVVQYTMDGYGRPASVAYGDDYAVAYEYDEFGRFIAVTSTLAGTFAYSYVSNAELIDSISNGDFAVTYTYEANRNLKTAVQNNHGATLISEYAYTYDPVGRRTLVENRGDAFLRVTNAFNLYDYNTRSELIDAARYLGDNPSDTSQPVTNETFSYAYDTIGNRLQASLGTTQTDYIANELNQYTNILRMGAPSWSPTYDPDGNLTNDSKNIYTWNAENRLVKAEPILLTNG
ncbi:MAG: hypothetical protein EOM12_11170, partial [Verrucomicrobiae bacterium]|nr:hypothetical protein [Verrucomicrobiae bacterium]